MRAAQICLDVVWSLVIPPPASPPTISLAMHPLMMAARLVSAVVFVFWFDDSVGQLRRDEWDTWSLS